MYVKYFCFYLFDVYIVGLVMEMEIFFWCCVKKNFIIFNVLKDMVLLLIL